MTIKNQEYLNGESIVIKEGKLNLIFNKDLPDVQFYLWARSKVDKWHGSFMKHFPSCAFTHSKFN